MYDNANNSAFWAVSPSSSGAQRDWQAHLPWGNTIYFDTAGCCDGTTQRLSRSITEFPDYSEDVTWWNDWHHLVFSKKADQKQIWIDGELFLEGSNTGVLPTDFTELFLGGQMMGTSLIHGLVDDFAVFSTALTEAQIGQLFGGTAPSAPPASAQLAAFWDFNDYPSDGQFVSLLPVPDPTSAPPNLVQVVHIDGSTPWTDSNVSLKVDGAAVLPTLSRDGGNVTVKYVPDTLFAPQSKHQAALTYPATGGTQTLERKFTVAPYARDLVAARVGVYVNGAAYSPNGGGHTGQAGDYAADSGRAAGRDQFTWRMAPS